MKKNLKRALLVTVAVMLAFMMTGLGNILIEDRTTKVYAMEETIEKVEEKEEAPIKQGLVNIVAYNITDIDNLKSHPFPIGGNWVNGDINTSFDLSGGELRGHKVNVLGSLQAGQVFTPEFAAKWKFEFATINGYFSTEPVVPVGVFPDGNPIKYNFFYSAKKSQKVFYVDKDRNNIAEPLIKAIETEEEWIEASKPIEIDGYTYYATNFAENAKVKNTYHWYKVKEVVEPVVTTGEIKVTSEIPFETVYEDDPTLTLGTEVVKTGGTVGEETATIEVTYTDGVETSRKTISTEITIKKVDKVILRGTKVPVVTPDPVVPDPVLPDPIVPDPVLPDPVVPEEEEIVPEEEVPKEEEKEEEEEIVPVVDEKPKTPNTGIENNTLAYVLAITVAGVTLVYTTTRKRFE